MAGNGHGFAFAGNAGLRGVVTRGVAVIGRNVTYQANRTTGGQAMTLPNPGEPAAPPSGNADAIEQLAAEAAEGSGEALGHLYDIHADKVFRLAFSKTGDHAAADDIAGDVWLRVTRNIASYERIGAGFSAWLCRIASRIIADHWRRTSRRRENLTGDMMALGQVAPGDGPEEAARRAEVARDAANLLRHLPDRQREVLVLRFWVGLSVAETAAYLSKSPGAVKQLAFRGLRTLREVLDDEVDRSGDRTRVRDVKTVVAKQSRATG
ncbi:RNA polymerase sigma factor [Actinopolymorpha sp. B17G11]|uniref:RNA polymerase sigma factor n=1 Tax=Actinopolymorpha sp. B17G11 TaxID=3160861 RepID=UPI0032E4D672